MPDTLETLLNLVLDTCGESEVAIGNGGRNNPANPLEEWYLYACWRIPSGGPIEDGEWEIDVHGATLRDVLCKAIAHPKFDR